jgi:hypothetical protein
MVIVKSCTSCAAASTTATSAVEADADTNWSGHSQESCCVGVLDVKVKHLCTSAQAAPTAASSAGCGGGRATRKTVKKAKQGEN